MLDSVNRKSHSPSVDSEFSLAATEVPHDESESDRRRTALCILHRIESRLPGRIRQLAVLAAENAIVLSGSCNTYYTKQVAQHTAMGVLEYDRLINNISVCTPK